MKIPTPDEIIKNAMAGIKPVMKIEVPKVEVKNNYNTTDGKPPRYICGNLQPINAK